jgi:uroporphyrinogen decarboxylase
MTSRERVLCALNHREPDRIPLLDTVWERTLSRWRGEGMEGDPGSLFGYELAFQGPDISLQLPPRVLEEAETYLIRTDDCGATQRVFKDHESTPELIDYTINSPEAWEEHRHRLTWNDARLDWDSALAGNRALREAGLFVGYFGHVGYDWLQRMVGNERMLIAMVENPAWVKDMMDTLMDLVLAGCDAMLERGFVFDGAFIADDMGYRNGTLFSPAVFRACEMPAQKRMYAFFNERNMPVIMHSCGNVSEFLPLLIEAGLTCMSPLEAKSGMDLVALKRAYGDKLCFMGGIDVRAMADPDPSAIETEIATKLPVAMQGGGYIYHSDHSIPDNVSYAQYRRVMELVREYGQYR